MKKEIKNARTHSGWYTSYMDDKQGIALIECLQTKVNQLELVIETIKGEIELSKDPKEEPFEVVLNSIESIIDGISLISSERGFFRWEI